MPAESFSQKELVIRPYRDGDEDAILDLFRRSFHAPRSPEHFRWKYLQNPFGVRRITLAFDGAGRLVGHYAGYPVPVLNGGSVQTAHQIGDTMTDPSVRHLGRGPTGVLGRTALDFYARFCENKVAFNYGFNVANIQKFSLRFLRSERVEPVAHRERDLAEMPLVPRRRLDRQIRGLTIDLVRETSAEWDEFLARVAPAYGFLIRRSAQYVRWRYLEHPDAQYVVLALRSWGRLIGWSVYQVRGDTLRWGDALFDCRWPEGPGILLETMASSVPVRRIEAWFPERPGWFDAALEVLGLRRIPEPQDLSMMCVPFTDADAAHEMRRRFYYALGDSDLF